MELPRKLIAIYLALTGVAVAVLLLATPLFHDGSDSYPAWEVLNWFMAAGALIILAVAIARRIVLSRMAEEDVDVRDWLRGGIVFYGAIVLASLFFWEFFWTLNPDSETGEAVTSHMVYFPLVDSMYTVLALMVAGRMWKAGG